MPIHSAQLRHLRLAPRKVRLVADAVKGLPVNEAEARLLLMPQRAAEPILKLLRSALAGARQKDLEAEKLYISSLRVDQAPMLKRFMMRARGGSSEIQKKASHVIMELGENPNQRPGRFTAPRKEKKRAAPEAPRKRAPRKVAEEKSAEAPKKKGILSKTFSRKSGEA